MKIHLTIALATVLTLSMNILPILMQQDTLNAQQSNQKKKLPPPPAPKSRGVPGNRTVSASMSGTNCELNLIALAPQFSQNAPGQTSETSVWGKTISAYPTFWFFIPATQPSTKIEFSIQDREEDIYRVNIPFSPQPGIIGIKIPTTQKPLQLDRNYHWTLKAKICDGTATVNRVHVDGWITKVELPKIIFQPNSSELYINNGIWYDAVTSLAQQRLQQPNDARISQNWRDLLESVNLTEVANQPLIR
jgi:hypothetical protein